VLCQVFFIKACCQCLLQEQSSKFAATRARLLTNNICAHRSNTAQTGSKRSLLGTTRRRNLEFCEEFGCLDHIQQETGTLTLTFQAMVPTGPVVSVIKSDSLG